MDDMILWKDTVEVLSGLTGAPSEAPTRSCDNNPDPWVGTGGKTKSCGDIAELERERNRKCDGLYREHCPGLCRNRCSCTDYEYPFYAKETSRNLVTCDTLTEDKCKHLRVKKNCRALCNDDCK